MSENIPHSLGGFRGAFESEHGRKPTEQEIWNAAIRSWRDITRQKSDSAKELEEVIADLLMYAGDNGYSHIDYADTMRHAAALLQSAALPVGELTYSLDADPQGIRARVVQAVLGALAFGARNENKPPKGHWLNEIWESARAEREDSVDRVATLFESMETPYLPDIANAIDGAAASSQPVQTVPDNMQDWKGMDGAIAFHLIERHADNWSDTGKMMGEWLSANQGSQPVREPLTDDQMWELWNSQGDDAMEQAASITFARAIEAAHGITKKGAPG